MRIGKLVPELAYHRHVHCGETMALLAREAGVHKSTILRHVRRIKDRRDDPLVNGAVEHPSPDPPSDEAWLALHHLHL